MNIDSLEKSRGEVQKRGKKRARADEKAKEKTDRLIKKGTEVWKNVKE